MPARPAKLAADAPRIRDAERTRQIILEAATDEFAALGLGGARMDRIAERAKVDKRLIYYYFNNKDDLFLSVLERAYAAIRQAEQELHLEALSPPEAVRKLVEFTWQYYLENPEFLCLLNSENLHQAAHLKRSSQVREMHSPFVQWLADILKRGHEQGLFRDGVDPVQLYISIASVAYFYLSNKFTLSEIFGRDLMAPEALDVRLAHMVDVILGYLRP
ncbi:TetR family transcriptional regulator [Pigmentiphaga sp. NML080357]|uniref:TetR/AcrR family transcriptional regulator n=1 Tax=Pigmentiphaga sp. NML080357 TaxID=2008675 RepID=UPI000B40F452|nr:TetR/AcrR family transcriptional regulator [Pigmentiphaga sp. NML080357]OVZ60798.1 TetR family transcriptional regulator [Pigmentiphaga sp. NML080357]